MDIKSFKAILNRITKKQTRPILRHALSNGIDLSVTNLETYLTLKGVNLPQGLISVDTLGITNKVLDLEVADYTIFPDFHVHGQLKVSIKTLELLLDSVSSDETRPYLMGIAWVNEDLVSTNGHIMTVISGQSNNPSDGGSSIFPGSSIKELVQVAKKFKLSEVSIQLGSEFFTVETDTFKLSGRLIKREYPRYKSIIPNKTSKQLTINKTVKFNDVKPILNNRTYGVRIQSVNGVTSLSVDGTDFKNEVGVGDELELGINLKYLEFLTNLDSKLKCNNELSPVMVNSGLVTRIAMPLKL